MRQPVKSHFCSQSYCSCSNPFRDRFPMSHNRTHRSSCAIQHHKFPQSHVERHTMLRIHLVWSQAVFNPLILCPPLGLRRSRGGDKQKLRASVVLPANISLEQGLARFRRMASDVILQENDFMLLFTPHFTGSSCGEESWRCAGRKRGEPPRMPPTTLAKTFV